MSDQFSVRTREERIACFLAHCSPKIQIEELTADLRGLFQRAFHKRQAALSLFA
jgi:hypothetical protein